MERESHYYRAGGVTAWLLGAQIAVGVAGAMPFGKRLALFLGNSIFRDRPMTALRHRQWGRRKVGSS